MAKSIDELFAERDRATARNPSIDELFELQKKPSIFSTPATFVKSAVAATPQFVSDVTRGAQAFTEGPFNKIDPLLEKVAETSDRFINPRFERLAQKRASGKLLPKSTDDLAEVANAWAAILGQQVPLLGATKLSQLSGAKIGGGIGTAIGATGGGGTPVTAATAPAGFLTGAGIGSVLAPLGVLTLQQSQAFRREAARQGIPEDLIDEQARKAGFLSGGVEFAQQALNLLPFAKGGKISVFAKNIKETLGDNAATRFLGELFDIGLEGSEEVSQGVIFDRFIKKAAEQAAARDPNFVANLDPSDPLRNFLTGAGVTTILKGTRRAADRVRGIDRSIPSSDTRSPTDAQQIPPVIPQSQRIASQQPTVQGPETQPSVPIQQPEQTQPVQPPRLNRDARRAQLEEGLVQREVIRGEPPPDVEGELQDISAQPTEAPLPFQFRFDPTGRLSIDEDVSDRQIQSMIDRFDDFIRNNPDHPGLKQAKGNRKAFQNVLDQRVTGRVSQEVQPPDDTTPPDGGSPEQTRLRQVENLLQGFQEDTPEGQAARLKALDPLLKEAVKPIDAFLKKGQPETPSTEQAQTIAQPQPSLQVEDVKQTSPAVVEQPVQPQIKTETSSGFKPPVASKSFNTVKDVLTFRDSFEKELRKFYKSLGMDDSQVNKFIRSDKFQSQTDLTAIEEGLTPENQEKLNSFSFETGPGFYVFDQRFNPEELQFETDKTELSNSIVRNLSSDTELPSQVGDKLFHAIFALKQLQKSGGTFSDIARALDTHTTLNTVSQEDKTFLFKKLGNSIHEFAQKHNIALLQGDLSKTKTSKRGGAAEIAEQSIESDLISQLKNDGVKINVSLKKGSAKDFRQRIIDLRKRSALRDILTTEGGQSIDEVATDRGFDNTDALIDVLEGGADQRIATRESARQEDQALQAERKEAEASPEGKTITALTKETKTTEPVNVNDLVVGSKFIKANTELEVTDVNADDNSVTVKDGRKFATADIPADTVIFPKKGSLKQPDEGLQLQSESIQEQEKRLTKQEQKKKVKDLSEKRLEAKSIDTTGELFDPRESEDPLFKQKPAQVEAQTTPTEPNTVQYVLKPMSPVTEVAFQKGVVKFGLFKFQNVNGFAKGVGAPIETAWIRITNITSTDAGEVAVPSAFDIPKKIRKFIAPGSGKDDFIIRGSWLEENSEVPDTPPVIEADQDFKQEAFNEGEGKIGVPVKDLEVGDPIHIAHVKFVVKSKGQKVELEDGPEFGTQTVSINDTIFINTITGGAAINEQAPDSDPPYFRSDKVGEEIKLTIAPSIVNQKSVEPLLKRLLKLKSGVDVLRETNNPVLIRIADAYEKQVDILADTVGKLTGMLRAVNKIPRKLFNRVVSKEFEIYQQANTRALLSKKKADRQEADRILSESSQETQMAVRALEKVFEFTGNENQKFGYKVLYQGEYVDIGNFGAKYWPLMVKAEIRDAIMRPHKHPEAYMNIVKRVMVHFGNKKGPLSEREAIALLKQRVLFESGSDFLAQVLFARDTPLPADFYEYRYQEVVPYFISKWSEISSKRQAYGQGNLDFNTGKLADSPPGSRNIFAESFDKLTDRADKEFLLSFARRAYEVDQHNEMNRAMRMMRSYTIITKLMSWYTAMRNLSTVPFNVMPELGPINTLKAGWFIVRNLEKATQTAEDAGVLPVDHMAAFAEAQKITGIERKIIKKALDIGAFTATERFNRMISAFAGIRFARDAIKSFETDPNSRRTVLYRMRLRSYNVDIQKLQRQGLDGSEGRKLMRAASNSTQFAYDMRQLPLEMTTPVMRWIMQFSAFGVQQTRRTSNLVFKETIVKDGGKTYFDPVPMVLTIAAMLGTGAGLLWIRAALSDRKRRDANWTEIKNTADEDEVRAVQLAVQRLFTDLIYSGGPGIVGDWSELTRGAFERLRGKNPVEPPSFSILRNTWDRLIVPSLQQRKFPGLKDWANWAGSELPGAKFATRSGLKIARTATDRFALANLQGIRADIVQVRKAAERYAEEQRLDRNRPGIGFSRTPDTPMFNELNEALLTGDSEKALAIKDDFIAGGKTFKEKQRRLRSLESSIRARAPMKLGGLEAEANQRFKSEFRNWVRDRNPALAPILNKLETEYFGTAHKVGLAKDFRVQRIREESRLIRDEFGIVPRIRKIKAKQIARQLGISEEEALERAATQELKNTRKPLPKRLETLIQNTIDGKNDALALAVIKRNPQLKLEIALLLRSNTPENREQAMILARNNLVQFLQLARPGGLKGRLSKIPSANQVRSGS